MDNIIERIIGQKKSEKTGGEKGENHFEARRNAAQEEKAVVRSTTANLATVMYR